MPWKCSSPKSKGRPDVDEVCIRRILNAPRERVFHAWTRPDLMARWFFAGEGWTTKATTDLSIGGRYEVLMRDGAGVEHAQFGRYREITPFSRLVFTWCCPDLGVEDSVVTVELSDRGARTELLLTHALPPDRTIRHAHQDGWEGCIGNLEKFIDREPGGSPT
jgi:uncharacterized protein YndB with AHSA1/START domain